MTDSLRPAEFYAMAVTLLLVTIVLLEHDWSSVAFALSVLIGVLYLD